MAQGKTGKLGFEFLPFAVVLVLVIASLCCASQSQAIALEDAQIAGQADLQVDPAYAVAAEDEVGFQAVRTNPAIQVASAVQGLLAQNTGDLQFVSFSGASVSGTASSGYTVYVRDGDTATVTLAVKNATGSTLEYTSMVDATTYDENGETIEPIEFPHPYYGSLSGGVTNAEYAAAQEQTSDTTGVSYGGFEIQAGVTATFDLAVKPGNLAAGSYNWYVQLGRQHFNHELQTEQYNGASYDVWNNVGRTVEETYTARIPLKVVVYNQKGASLKAGQGTGFDPVQTQLPVGGIDLGSLDLAGDADALTGSYDINVINSGTPNVFTDAHGNTTSIGVVFGGEVTSDDAAFFGATPFSWGNGTLYDTNWEALPPATVNGNSTSFNQASYTVSYDATYLIAGTYTCNLIINTTPHKVSINGAAGNDTGVYAFPFKVKLTGTNPRLLPRATGLKASAGNGQVELTWTPGQGADEYTEYSIWRREGTETRKNPDNFDWSLYEQVGTKAVGTGAQPLYVDADVENGKTYSYTVICGSPYRGYACKAASATPDASIASRLLAPRFSAYGYANQVELSWEMNESYGGDGFDGAGMVDHFNIYRDGVLVDQVYQSAVTDSVSYGWHDDGTGTGAQVYGPTKHEYEWVVNEPVEQLYVPYAWTVSAVSLSGVEGYLSEEASDSAYSDKPVILGHEAWFDNKYYVYANLDEFNDVPAIAIRIDNRVAWNSAEELTFWRHAGTTAPDTSAAPYMTVSGRYDDRYGGDVSFADKNVKKGKTYTYTVRATGEDGSTSEDYTFSVKAVAPTDDGYVYFSSPVVTWSVENGTSARLRFTAPSNVTARVYRNGTNLKAKAQNDLYGHYFDVADNPGADGSYTYRVEYTENKSGITTDREFTFVRNTKPVDTRGLLKPPDAPTLTGRASGDSNVILSWAPSATGGEPEGYHVYRVDAGKQVTGGRYLTANYWNGAREYWKEWGNGRYFSLEGADTLSFVDGTSGDGSSYKGDSHLGQVEGIAWDDGNAPHEYWITAYNRAGESAPSKTLVLEAAQDENGNPVAPVHEVQQAPASPSITDAWISWDDGSSYAYGFDAELYGRVLVAWDDSGLGGEVENWTATFVGTHYDQNNPPQTSTLAAHQAILDPAVKLGASKNAPSCFISSQAGEDGELGRSISVTVTASNAVGSAVSDAVSVNVNSLPRFYALPDSGGALLRWTDLVNDASTQVTSWELWRKAPDGEWQHVGTHPATSSHDGVGKDIYGREMGYYEWADDDALNGLTYQYQVIAKCSDGVDRPSVTREVTPVRTAAAQAPGVPQNLRYQVVNGEVAFSWDAPTTGGAPQFYQVMRHYSESWGEGWQNAGSEVGADSTSSVWAPGEAGTYRCFVYAYSYIGGVREPGWGSYDDPFEAQYPTASNIIDVTVTERQVETRANEAPDAPALSAVPSDNQVTLTWAACKGATYYVVDRINYDHADIPDVTIVAVPGQASYSYTDVDAQPGVRYRYVVTAHNAYGARYSDIYAKAGTSYSPGGNDGDEGDDGGEGERVDISSGALVLSEADFTFDGKAHEPGVVVRVAGETLSDSDFSLAYADNVKAGTGTITATGIGLYKGELTATFTIAKAQNTLSAKAKPGKIKVKAKALQKKKKVLKRAKAFTVSAAKGKLSFQKLKGNKRIAIGRGGKVTLKKNLKAGSYKVRVRVSAAGNANYMPASKVVKLKIRVK